MPAPMLLPAPERQTIARVAVDAARHAEETGLAGPRKFRLARAYGMRELKRSGMPQQLATSLHPFVEPGDADTDEDLDELSADERALLDAGKGAASASVGIVAGAIERDTGCHCNAQVLALVRALLEAGIETAVQAARA